MDRYINVINGTLSIRIILLSSDNNFALMARLTSLLNDNKTNDNLSQDRIGNELDLVNRKVN
jgi:hypothetical protein